MPNSRAFSVERHSKFDFLGDEFQNLFHDSEATAFQAPLWLHHIYEHLVPALGVKPIVLTVRDLDSGELKIVLPLVQSSYAGLTCIEPADMGICDYNAVIACPALADRFFSDDILQKQVHDALGSSHLIFFRKMRGECEVIDHVVGDVTIGDMENSSHHVDLFGPFDEWKKQNLSANFRKEVRRKKKKLGQMGETKFSILTDENEIRQAMELMREQRNARYEDDLFAQDAYFEFYCRIAAEGAKTGYTQTAILEVESTIVAVEFGLIHNNCYHFVLAGMDSFNYSKASPGIIMIDHVLELRVAAGDTKADFTIGDEAYKARYNTKATQLKHIAKANTVLGSLASRHTQTAAPSRPLPSALPSLPHSCAPIEQQKQKKAASFGRPFAWILLGTI